MNDRELVQTEYGVGEQVENAWPVFAIAVWNDGTISVRYMATFLDHETADEFCRRWRTEPPEDADVAGFRRR